MFTGGILRLLTYIGARICFLAKDEEKKSYFFYINCRVNHPDSGKRRSQEPSALYVNED